MPDEELLRHAAAGDLQKPDVLLAQTRRMLKDERVRGLATEFGGNWLDFRHFETNNTVDRERFPSFNNDLREAMFQEPIRFIEDVIHNDRSVLDLLYGNYTFVNPVLAKHYGMPEVTGQSGHLGSRGRRRSVRARRSAADGGLPHAELARPANQSGEARILGGAARARRSDPAAAAGGAGIAGRRSEIGSAAARHAGASIARIRCAPPAMRASIRSAWRSKATDRWARRGPKTLRDGRSIPTRSFPGGSQGAGFEGVRDLYPRTSPDRTSWIISAANCWPTR